MGNESNHGGSSLINIAIANGSNDGSGSLINLALGNGTNHSGGLLNIPIGNGTNTGGGLINIPIGNGAPPQVNPPDVDPTPNPDPGNNLVAQNEAISLCGVKPIVEHDNSNSKDGSQRVKDIACREDFSPDGNMLAAVTEHIKFDTVSFEEKIASNNNFPVPDLNKALTVYTREMAHGNEAMAEIETIITLREMGINAEVARSMVEKMNTQKMIVDHRLSKILRKMAKHTTTRNGFLSVTETP